MVRILRIISQIAFAASCAIAIFVLAFGFKPQLEIQTILSQTSIIDELKNRFGDITKTDDKEHPLVAQARAFALRIDPPPVKITPPLPKYEPEPLANTRPIGPVYDPPIEPAEVKLIGTASYRDYPEKSLALLSSVSGGYKWVRLGEQFEESTVVEIKEGKIVLCLDGKNDKNLFMPKRQPTLKPLLKN